MRTYRGSENLIQSRLNNAGIVERSDRQEILEGFTRSLSLLEEGGLRRLIVDSGRRVGVVHDRRKLGCEKPKHEGATYIGILNMRRGRVVYNDLC
jgi:hypothetical protein